MPAAHLVLADLSAATVDLDEGDSHHLASVLRLRPGEEVGATDGAGGYRLYRWAGQGTLRAAGDPAWVPRPLPALTVAFAAVKGERPEWAVQKLAELGVDRIVFLDTARAVVRWDSRRVQRMRRVARQAVMQSKGVWLVAVDGPVPLSAVTGDDRAALASPGSPPPGPDLATVLVGPEGGWTAEELASAPATVGLGPTVLRTETAAVAAGVLLSALRAGVVGPAGR